MQAPEHEFVCQRLRAERQRLGLTQEDVGNICATAVQTVRRWEKATPVPSDKLAQLVAHGFDGQYILSGVASANLGALSGSDGLPHPVAPRLLAVLGRLNPTQQKILVEFIEAVVNAASGSDAQSDST
jgi:transcriptional regulator with XRE-family HTH domain